MAYATFVHQPRQASTLLTIALPLGSSVGGLCVEREPLFGSPAVTPERRAEVLGARCGTPMPRRRPRVTFLHAEPSTAAGRALPEEPRDGAGQCSIEVILSSRKAVLGSRHGTPRRGRALVRLGSADHTSIIPAGPGSAPAGSLRSRKVVLGSRNGTPNRQRLGWSG